jgi:adenylate kinase
MNILLIGPPGSGKSTQSGFLAERLMIPRIAATEVLTAAVKGDLPGAGAIHQAMKTGALVPDDIVSGVLIALLRRSDCATGFILDGFPRTAPQAAALDQAAIRLDYVIELILEDAEVFRRLTGRRIHEPSGRTYHLSFNPPKIDDRDDVTGEPLIQRDDDREGVVRRRLALTSFRHDGCSTTTPDTPTSIPALFRSAEKVRSETYLIGSCTPSVCRRRAWVAPCVLRRHPIHEEPLR